jgi:hypothetical protein
MSTLTILLDSLDDGQFDCIEYGDSGTPGRTPGSLRLRRGDDAGTYELSRITPTGGEEAVTPLVGENIEAALVQFTAPVAKQSRFARFFPLTLRGSRR